MKRTKKLTSGQPGLVLGDRVFAAITAIEGIKLGSASRSRLSELKKRKLSHSEQRAEIVRAYRGAKDK